MALAQVKEEKEPKKAKAKANLLDDDSDESDDADDGPRKMSNQSPLTHGILKIMEGGEHIFIHSEEHNHSFRRSRIHNFLTRSIKWINQARTVRV